MPLIILLALAGLAVVAAGGSSKSGPGPISPKPGCPVPNAEITAALNLPNNITSLPALSAMAARLDVCVQTKAAADVRAKSAAISTATGGACPVPSAEINAANALLNTPENLTALGIMATRLKACKQDADEAKISAKVAIILGGLGVPPGGLGLAPPDTTIVLPPLEPPGGWGVPGLGFDRYGILTAIPGFPQGPLGPVPGIDKLPVPEPHDMVVKAVAYGTDPGLLKTLSESLRATGYEAAANEVLRAAGLIYTQAAWPESRKLPTLYKSRAFHDAGGAVSDGLGVLDGLDYFALSGLPFPDGTARKFCVGTCSYTDLLSFQKALGDGGVFGTWTAEIAAAVARLKLELGI